MSNCSSSRVRSGALPASPVAASTASTSAGSFAGTNPSESPGSYSMPAPSSDSSTCQVSEVDRLPVSRMRSVISASNGRARLQAATSAGGRAKSTWMTAPASGSPSSACSVPSVASIQASAGAS